MTTTSEQHDDSPAGPVGGGKASLSCQRSLLRAAEEKEERMSKKKKKKKMSAMTYRNHKIPEAVSVQNGVPNASTGVFTDTCRYQGLHHRLCPHNSCSGKKTEGCGCCCCRASTCCCCDSFNKALAPHIRLQHPLGIRVPAYFAYFCVVHQAARRHFKMASITVIGRLCLCNYCVNKRCCIGKETIVS